MRQVIEGARPVVVLAQDRLAGRPPAGGAPVLSLDELDSPERARQEPSPIPWPDARNLAYLIQTSGWTGRPRGSMSTHGRPPATWRWSQATYGADPTTVAILRTPISFDASVRDLFWPLSAGGTLVLPPPGRIATRAWRRAPSSATR